MGNVKFMNRLREIRKFHGLTQGQLAAAINTTSAQISRLEKGQRELSEHWIKLLTRELAVTADQLLGLNGHTIEKPSDTPDESMLRLVVASTLSYCAANNIDLDAAMLSNSIVEIYADAMENITADKSLNPAVAASHSAKAILRAFK